MTYFMATSLCGILPSTHFCEIELKRARPAGKGSRTARTVPPAGFEPAHRAPEARALSPELRGLEGWRTHRNNRLHAAEVLSSARSMTMTGICRDVFLS